MSILSLYSKENSCLGLYEVGARRQRPATSRLARERPLHSGQHHQAIRYMFLRSGELVKLKENMAERARSLHRRGRFTYSDDLWACFRVLCDTAGRQQAGRRWTDGAIAHKRRVGMRWEGVLCTHGGEICRILRDFTPNRAPPYCYRYLHPDIS